MAMSNMRNSLSKELVNAARSRLNGEPTTDEELIDALFVLFQCATTHTIAWIITKHGNLVLELMASKYANRDRAYPDDEE